MEAWVFYIKWQGIFGAADSWGISIVFMCKGWNLSRWKVCFYPGELFPPPCTYNQVPHDKVERQARAGPARICSHLLGKWDRLSPPINAGQRKCERGTQKLMFQWREGLEVSRDRQRQATGTRWLWAWSLMMVKSWSASQSQPKRKCHFPL